MAGSASEQESFIDLPSHPQDWRGWEPIEWIGAPGVCIAPHAVAPVKAPQEAS
jgi:hypothetical protein